MSSEERKWHPEFEEEKIRLFNTKHHIEDVLYGAVNAPPTYGQKHELKGRHEFLSGKHHVLSQALLDSPYFGRFDFRQNDIPSIDEFYEGLGLQDGPLSVIYWASPIGALFYQTSRAKVTYVAPDGNIAGDVYLRRRLRIQQGILLEVIDEFDRRRKVAEFSEDKSEDEETLSNPDEYLRLILEGKKGKGLQEVVTSIQERQNEIMRVSSDRILVVQGPAGSGKTIIALHRVATLLYQLNRQKDDASILVIGANKVFLKFVANVLPSININNVPQRTFADWAYNITGYEYIRSIPDLSFSEIMSAANWKDSQYIAEKGRAKGSLKMIPILTEFVEKFRLRVPQDSLAFFPTGRGSLGMFYTISSVEIREIVEETRSEPVNIQRDRVVDKIVQHLIDQHESNYRAWTFRIAALVNNPIPNLTSYQLEQWERQLEEYGYRREDGELRLPPSRDVEILRSRAIRSIRDELGQLVSDNFPRFSSLDLYIQLLTDRPMLERLLHIPREADHKWILARGDYQSEELQEKMRLFDILLQTSDFSEKDLRVEDIASVVFLHLLLNGRGITVNIFDHIIVDEAQDVSPLELWLLRSFVTTGSMTILGDLAQAIHPYKGVSNWNEFSEVFSKDVVQYEEIERTYRSTYEIMTFANNILSGYLMQRHKYPQAIPFERHGPHVKTQAHIEVKGQLEFIASEIDRLLSQGYATVAVICKTDKQVNVIDSYLRKLDYPSQTLLATEAEYGLQLSVVPVNLAKGIEFDACIVAYADSVTFPADELHGRLLYVAVTRGLHELVVTWTGAPSRHLYV